ERQPSPELAAGTAVAPRQPTPYRYAALVSRAKELTQMAGQMEAALLAALEKRDAESYNLLKAGQDLELAGATVDLQELRVKEATDGITLAALQQGRAQIQFDHFDELLEKGSLPSEIASGALAAIGAVASSALSGAAKGSVLGGGLAGGALGAGVGLISGLGSIFGLMASNERRKEEWELNH